MLRYTIDRARPGLVAFYNIRPWNGVDLFFQPGTCTGRRPVVRNGSVASVQQQQHMEELITQDWKMTDQTAGLAKSQDRVNSCRAQTVFRPVLLFLQPCRSVRHFPAVHFPSLAADLFRWQEIEVVVSENSFDTRPGTLQHVMPVSLLHFTVFTWQTSSSANSWTNAWMYSNSNMCEINNTVQSEWEGFNVLINTL